MAWKGRKKSIPDLSGETGQDSGTENQRGTETGIETGIERETEDLVVVVAHLVKEGEWEVVTEWMGENGSVAGRKKEANTREVGGRETVIGREIGTGTVTVIERETETGIGIGIGTEIEIEIETETETETDGTGGRGEAAWIVTGDEGGVMTARGIEGGGREETEEGEMEGSEKEGGEQKVRKGTGQGGQNGEKGPHGGTKMTDWPNLKTWTDFGPLTTRSNLV